MADMDIPVTTAIRALRDAHVAFEAITYTYVDHGGTAHAAQALGVPEHATVKTIVMETEAKKPLIILMHGDCEISAKQLARQMGVKSVSPCTPDTATRHTGYMVGGTSPFGLRKQIPVFAEETLFALPELYINGGRRGLLVKIAPAVLEQLLKPMRVAVAIPGT
jgi:Cys-tRNA(Pro) deacylase